MVAIPSAGPKPIRDSMQMSSWTRRSSVQVCKQMTCSAPSALIELMDRMLPKAQRVWVASTTLSELLGGTEASAMALLRCLREFCSSTSENV